jgi:5,10-methylenetetrahydromethanopterin reductase
MTLELFTMSIPEPSLVEYFATHAEAEGWDGITFTDSQNLVGDPFIGIAIGARVTERLQFMTGVSNPATRHPAALATVAATPRCSTWGAIRSRSRSSSRARTSCTRT